MAERRVVNDSEREFADRLEDVVLGKFSSTADFIKAMDKRGCRIRAASVNRYFSGVHIPPIDVFELILETVGADDVEREELRSLRGKVGDRERFYRPVWEAGEPQLTGENVQDMISVHQKFLKKRGHYYSSLTIQFRIDCMASWPVIE